MEDKVRATSHLPLAVKRAVGDCIPGFSSSRRVYTGNRLFSNVFNLMLLGRLEISTVLVLLFPTFWKK
jgi:hypothetical protein